MQFKNLGNSGLVVSRLSFGAMMFGEGEFFGLKVKTDQNVANQMVAQCLDVGINLFDTANVYFFGMSEQMLSKALGGKRKDVVIATKCGIRIGEQPLHAGISAKHIIESAEASLKRLNTDYIDVYIIHCDDPVTPVEETLRALENLTQRGLIRYSGFSNWHTWKAAKALEIQKYSNYSPFITSQMNYSLLGRDIEHEFVPFLKASGMGLMAYSPLAMGFLTGKYTRENPKPEGCRLSTFDLGLIDKERGYPIVDKVINIAKKYNTKPSHVAISWLLSKEYVSTVIIGATKINQLTENLASLDLKLADEDITLLDETFHPHSLYPNILYHKMMDPVLSSIKH